MNDIAQKIADSKYRRGTVLGLTVAEIFILLLFLLMLVFLVIWQDLQAQQMEQQEANEQLQRELEPLREFKERWEEPLEGVETPTELRNLQEFNEQWEEPLEGIETPDEILTLKELKEDLERLQGDAGEELLRDLVEAERGMREAIEDNEQLREELKNERQYREETQDQISQLNNELRVLNKGQNPPCWYEVVRDDNTGTERERFLYAFDIGVFDEYMEIRRREPPSGGAFDDGDTSYAEEWDALGFADIRYDVPLSNEQLTAELRQIHEAGKQGRVRSYSCIFSVRVWDMTSSGAKARWQQAHDRTLEWLFGTFRVEDETEPWVQSR